MVLTPMVVLCLVFAAPEVRLLLPEEVPPTYDGGGVELSSLRSAVDPVLDVAVLALAGVAIVEGAASVFLAAQDPAFFAVDAVVGVVVLECVLVGLVQVLVPDDLGGVVVDLDGHLHTFALLTPCLLWLLFSLAGGGGWGTG